MPMRWVSCLLLFVVGWCPSRCWALLSQQPTTIITRSRSRSGNNPPYQSSHLDNAAISILEDPTITLQLVVAGTLGVVTDPLVGKFLNIDPKSDDNSLKDTLIYGIADSLSNAARIYGFFVVLSIVLSSTDTELIDSSSLSSLYQITPKLTLTIWAALSLSTVKRSFFYQKVSGDKLGRVQLVDQLLDFIICIVTGLVLVDELTVSFNFSISDGLQSIFAASGVGALAVSLASKDLLEQIIGGFLVQAWDCFQVGDDILLGDGTEGTIQKIGLVETEVCGYDNIIIQIPNAQISRQRISNVSRTKCSRVQQVLRFSYQDINVIPKVLQDIKDEIQASCSETLITDDSKPFSAVLSDYEADHIQTTVMCHFTVQPGTAQYRATKEQVLLAIARAVSKSDIQFAIPAISYVDRRTDNGDCIVVE